MITQKRLKQLLNYNPATGFFVNLISRGRSGAGSRAGTLGGKDFWYRYIVIDGVHYAEHRLAFLYMIGRFPKDEVDHKNGVKCYNAWKNLREATRYQNLANAKSRRQHALKGTYPLKSGRFGARINHRKKTFRIGTFATQLEAHFAYLKKARELNGEFARVFT